MLLKKAAIDAGAGRRRGVFQHHRRLCYLRFVAEGGINDFAAALSIVLRPFRLRRWIETGFWVCRAVAA